METGQKAVRYDWTKAQRSELPREAERKRERRRSRERLSSRGRLAIDQMESLANQLGAPTAARKRLQVDLLLPRLSDYSAKRQRRRDRVRKRGLSKRWGMIYAWHISTFDAYGNYYTTTFAGKERTYRHTSTKGTPQRRV